MAKTIIQEHMHGTITLKNQESGVAFFITLPVTQPAEAQV